MSGPSIVILFVCLIVSCVGVNNTIRICALVPLTPGRYSTQGLQWQTVIQEAVSAINQGDFISGYQLEVLVLDTLDTRPGTANASIQAVNLNCVGVIDVLGSAFSELAQKILQNYKIPQISAASSAAALSNKRQYPTFLRVFPSTKDGGLAIARLVQRFKWKKVAVISAMDSYSVSYYESFKGAINEDVISIVRFVDPTFTTNYSAQVRDIKNANRAIIVVFALVPDMERILDAANAHKLLGSPYDRVPRHALLGSLTVTPLAITNTTLAQQYRERVHISHHNGGSVYDVVYTYAHAFKEGGWEDPQKLLSTLNATGFDGVSGFVSFDEHGDRSEYYYEVYNWQKEGRKSVGNLSWDGTFDLQPIVWSTDSSETPNDSFENTPLIHATLDCLVVAILLLVGELILLAVYLRKARMEKTPVIAKKCLVAAGNTLGYAAVIIVILHGPTKVGCTIIPVLLDTSFLLCGGTLSLVAMQKLISDYKHMVVAPKFGIGHVKRAAYVVWLCLITFNVLSLVLIFSFYPLPCANKDWLPSGKFEHRCNYHITFVLLPVSIQLIYLFYLLVKLFNAFVNSAVAIRNEDIFNPTIMVLTFLVISVGLIFVVVVTPTLEESIAVVISGLSSPVDMLTWLRSNRATGYQPISRVHASSIRHDDVRGDVAPFHNLTLGELNE